MLKLSSEHRNLIGIVNDLGGVLLQFYRVNGRHERSNRYARECNEIELS